MQNVLQTENRVHHALSEIASVAEEHTAENEKVSAAPEQMTDRRASMYTESLCTHGGFFNTYHFHLDPYHSLYR